MRACFAIESSATSISSVKYHTLCAVALNDPDYQSLVPAVKDGFPASHRDHSPALTPFWNGCEHLSLDSGIVLRGCRIVVPCALRRRVLADLNSCHEVIEQMKCRAYQTVF